MSMTKILEYTCPSCGSNLSYIQKKHLFECGFCGGLYNDDIRRVDVSLIEDLKDKRLFTQAREYAEYLVEKDPKDWKYQWEKLTCTIDPHVPSLYIRRHSKSTDITSLTSSLSELRETLPDDMKHYVDEIHELYFLYSCLEAARSSSNDAYIRYRKSSARERIRPRTIRGENYVISQNMDILFFSIWGISFIFGVAIINKLGSLAATISGVIAMFASVILYFVLKNRYLASREHRDSVSGMRPIMNDYEQITKENEEKITKLRSEIDRSTDEVRRSEEHILEELVRETESKED